MALTVKREVASSLWQALENLHSTVRLAPPSGESEPPQVYCPGVPLLRRPRQCVSAPAVCQTTVVLAGRGRTAPHCCPPPPWCALPLPAAPCCVAPHMPLRGCAMCATLRLTAALPLLGKPYPLLPVPFVCTPLSRGKWVHPPRSRLPLPCHTQHH
jgi:hypothetical protein